MKKFFSCAAIAALSIAGFSSCSEDLEAPRASGMAGAIRFGLVQNNATKGIGTTSTNFLSQIKDFQVWAYYDGTATGEGVEPGDRYIGVSDTEGTFIDGDGKGTWRYRDELGLQYWPATTAPLNFQAITPASDASFTISNTPADNLSHLTAVVNVPTDVKLQKDIMFAKADKQTYESNANCVSLMFNHSLSQVVFNGRLASNKITAEVSSIEIANVHSKGNVGYFASDASLGSEVTGEAETTFSLGIADDNIIDITTPKSLTSEDGALLMLPQNVTAWTTSAGTPVSTSEADAAHNSYLKIKCTVTDNTSGTVLINDEYVYIPFEISWQQGKKYIYTLVFGDLSNGYDENGESLKNMLPITYTVTTGDEWEQVEGGEYGVGGEEPGPDFTKMVKASYKGTAGEPTTIYKGNISQISAMYVDGKEVDLNTTYTDPLNNNFDVYFALKDPTAISSSAFSGCKGLTSVTIPNSVESIGREAFRGCSGLTSVTIPNSVTSIADYAFYYCSGLTSVHISDIAAWCNIKFETYDCNPLYYAHHLYLNGEEVKDLVIPNSVTSIGFCAFQNCTGLTSVTIPNSVTSIGDYAFEDCSGFTSVTIGNSVESIGRSAFQDCKGLSSVTIPNSVKIIGDKAFYYCSGLSSATIGNSVTSIGNSAFYRCSGLTSVTIPNSVESIGQDAFNSCSRLASITIGNSVKTIGNKAFYQCSGLTSVHISDIAAWCNIDFPSNESNPLYLAKHLYLNGEEVKDLVIPNSVTSIKDRAFYYWSNLTSVTIGNSVTSIGREAFYGCGNLSSIRCSAMTAPTLSSYVFMLVASNGILYVSPDATGYDAWLDPLPSGWTIEYSDEL